MAVPANLAALSTTASSNPPGGSEAVFPQLDDHLRFGYACSAQLRDLIAALDTTVRTDLTSHTDAAKGAGQVGFAPTLSYPADTAGCLLYTSPSPRDA